MKSLHLKQAQYLECPESAQTAIAIISNKCQNMEALLQRSCFYRRARYPAQYAILRNAIIEIQNARRHIFIQRPSPHLFLCEARASKSYWSAFRVLIRAPADWRRVYPKAQDPWNQALNIGYTILLHKIKRAVLVAELDPEIGLLHASLSGKDALVYDLMEIFRQPIVDIAVIRLFSRESHPSEIDPRAVIREVAIRCSMICSYQGRRVTREKIIEMEVNRFKLAIENANIFQPTKIRI